MRALLRLTLWGAAATCALVVAAVAALSNTGWQRMHGRSNRIATAQQSAPAALPNVAELARTAKADSERRRLFDAVRKLSADRDRLVSRMVSLEHSLDGITGSIKRPAVTSAVAPTVTASPPAKETAESVTTPLTPRPVPTSAVPPVTVVVSAAKPAPAPAPDAEKDATSLMPMAKDAALAASTGPVVTPVPVIMVPEPPERPAAATPEPSASDQVASRQQSEATDEPGSRLGVDVGGAVSFDGLRALWKSLTHAHGALFDDLHPVFVARENTHPREIELRLIAGPVVDVQTAAKICAALSAARRFCRPAQFKGQELSMATVDTGLSKESDRRSASARAERKVRAPATARPPRRVP